MTDAPDPWDEGLGGEPGSKAQGSSAFEQGRAIRRYVQNEYQTEVEELNAAHVERLRQEVLTRVTQVAEVSPSSESDDTGRPSWRQRLRNFFAPTVTAQVKLSFSMGALAGLAGALVLGALLIRVAPLPIKHAPGVEVLPQSQVIIETDDPRSKALELSQLLVSTGVAFAVTQVDSTIDFSLGPAETWPPAVAQWFRSHGVSLASVRHYKVILRSPRQKDHAPSDSP